MKPLEKALKLLSRKQYSRFEIKERLLRKYSEEEADKTVTKLEEIGLIDDEKYAKSIARSRLLYSHRGKQAIKIELIQKHISKDIIDETVLALNKDDEYTSAKELLESRLGRWKDLDINKKKQRAISLLTSHGFSYDISIKLLELVS